MHKPIRIFDDMEKKVVDMATKNKRRLWTTLFNTVFTGTGRTHAQGINLNSTSHTQIGNTLPKHGIRHRQSKITLTQPGP